MVVHKDFTVSAENLRWVGPDELNPVIPGKRYKTPSKFYEDTLIVMFRGLPLSKNNDDGFIIIDDETFELKETYNGTRDWFMAGYIIKEA